MSYKKQRVQELVDGAKAIVAQVENENRRFTETERKSIGSAMTEAKSLRADIEEEADLVKTFEALGGTSGTSESNGNLGTSLYGAVKAAGFDVRSKPHVMLDAKSVLGFGRKTFMSAGENSDILGATGLSPFGQDDRRLLSRLPVKSIGTATLVHELRQSARSLATPDNTTMDLQGSAEKPVSTVSLELATFEPKMIATVSESIPNALANQEAVQRFVDSELRYAVDLGIEDYVVETIAGVTGNAVTAGADPLHDVYRKAITTHAAQGMKPSLFVVSPGAYQDFVLSKDGDDNYLRDPSNAGGIWGVPVAECISVADGSPLLLDTSRFGYIGLGTFTFDANPYTGFTTNTTVFRVEVSCAPVVIQATAVTEITL